MKKLLLLILAIFITSCSNTFLSEYDNMGFQLENTTYDVQDTSDGDTADVDGDDDGDFVFFHNSDKYMTYITAGGGSKDDWDCYIYENKKDGKISCPVEDDESVCKIIKNTSNVFIDECQFCDGSKKYIITFEYSISDDILTSKISTDYLDGSDVEEETSVYRRTSRTLESFECN